MKGYPIPESKRAAAILGIPLPDGMQVQCPVCDAMPGKPCRVVRYLKGLVMSAEEREVHVSRQIQHLKLVRRSDAAR